MIHTYAEAPRNTENEAKSAKAGIRYGNIWASHNNTNILYIQATRGHTNRYANELIDAALEKCGCPYCYTNRTAWAEAAQRFLALFDQPTEPPVKAGGHRFLE